MGQAQALYTEQGGKLAIKPLDRSIKRPIWPFIEKMVSTGYLSYFDYALAEILLRPFPNIGEDVAAFLCHLSVASREGHICIKVSQEKIFPDPRECWIDSSEERERVILSDEEMQSLSRMIVSGAAQIPQGLASLVYKEDLFYFQRHWVYENEFLTHFKRIVETTPKLSLDVRQIQERVEESVQKKELLPDQARAVQSACVHSLTVLCGGPGTGKTHTAGNLIKILWSSLTSEQKKRYEIVLAAPTGKAAANLQNSLNRATKELSDFPPLKAKTLHSLLGIRKNSSHREVETLSADLVIVDESSMIDAPLMGHLFASIKPGGRLVLLGDRHQLPPVSAGGFFADLVEHLLKISSDTIIELQQCLRAELKSIVSFAKCINEGDSDSVLSILEKKEQGISRFKYEEDVRRLQREILDYVVPNFLHLSEENAQEFCLLSPLRKGPLGVDELNRLIFAQINKKKRDHSSIAIPIMIVANNPRLELFNGEVGVLIKHGDFRVDENNLTKEDYAFFANRKVPALLLPKYEYAYCVSVHKSQGSEFGHVFLLMPNGAEQFGREALYTAATRAKRKLEICGSDAVIKNAIGHHSRRLSGVLCHFNQMIQEQKKL